jgi:hypothetical protein
MRSRIPLNSNDSALYSFVPKSCEPRRLSACVSFLLMGVVLVTLTGCGPKRMKADYIGFEKAYAETSNREVLLNLARLQNHDTTYFFRLGQISSSYTMGASLAGSGQYVIQGQGVGGGNAIGGGNPSVSFSNTPAFTFIPVNDETSAQLLLKPVPAQTLYNLYLQGWRVDQLFRLMVDRIELTSANADGKGCTVHTYRNVPPPVRSKLDTSSDKDYLLEASGYATFLRVSALVYGLQKHGHLLLKGTSIFVPIDPKSAISAESDKADSTSPKPSDMAAAAAKNESWEYDAKLKRWVLGEQVFGAQFYLNDPSQIETDIKGDSRLEGLENGESFKESVAILSGGFSIEEPRSGGSGNDFCPSIPAGGAAVHLVMRSLVGLMAAVAQEQAPFEALLSNPTLLPKANPADVRQMTFAQAVPPIERIPALRLRWNAEEKGGPPLVEVNYRGGNYEIADANNPQVPENQYWNRDMFRLVNQLTAQVTVDISKFPLPGILQLQQLQ